MLFDDLIQQINTLLDIDNKGIIKYNKEWKQVKRNQKINKIYNFKRDSVEMEKKNNFESYFYLYQADWSNEKDGNFGKTILT